MKASAERLEQACKQYPDGDHLRVDVPLAPGLRARGALEPLAPGPLGIPGPRAGAHPY